MKKLKRALITCIAALTAATSVIGMTGCFGSDDDTDFTKDVEVVAYDGSEVTVTFYHTMGQSLRTVLDTYIPDFNAMYPNIKIVHDQIGNYNDVRTTIQTELGDNKSPSIAYCYPDHVALYNTAGAVAPLDGFIDSTLTVSTANGSTEQLGFTAAQKADFIKAYYDEGKAYGDDKMYTLPYAKSTEVLYYNATVFAENGWEVPTTWTEMETLCRAIKAKYPNDVPLGYDSEANWFITMAEQYGSPYTSATGDHFLYNNETNRNFVKMFRDWHQEGLVTTQEIYGKYTSVLFTGADVEGKKCYMCIGSSGGASHQAPSQAAGTGNITFTAGIAMIPQIDTAKPKVIQQGPSLCIFKKNNPQEVAATWLFAKFLTTHVELQAEFSMASGYAPVIKSVQENSIYKKFLDDANGTTEVEALAVKQALAQQDAYFVSPAFVGSSAARDAVGALMQACFTKTPSGNQTVAQLIEKEFATSIEKLLHEGYM